MATEKGPKLVYTPKDPKNAINVDANTASYHCEAYTYFKEKRKDDLLEIVNEIDRRESIKFHLPKI